MKPMKSVLLGTLVNSIFGFQRNLNHDRVAEIDISKVTTPEKLDDKTLNRILNEFKVDKELFSILTDVIDGKNIEIDDELLARVGRNESLKNVIMQSKGVSDDIKKVLHQYGRYSSGRFKYVAPRSAKLPNDVKNAKSYSTALDRVGKQIFNIRNDEEFLARKEMYKELMLSGNCTAEDYNTIINDILEKTDDVEFKKMVLSGIEDKNLDSFALRNLGGALLHEPDVSVIECALEHFNPNLLCHQFGKETQFPLGTLYRFYPTFTDKMGDALLKHSSELAYLKEEDARVFSSFLAKTVKMPDNFYKGMILQLGDKALTFETMPYSVCEWYVKKDAVYRAVAASSKTPIKYLEQISKMNLDGISLIAKANLSLVGMISETERQKILDTIFKENWNAINPHLVAEIDNKVRKTLHDVLNVGEESLFPGHQYLNRMLAFNNPMICKFNPEFLVSCAEYLDMSEERGCDILNVYFMTQHLLHSQEYKYIMVEHEMQKEYEEFREKEKASANKEIDVNELLSTDGASVPVFDAKIKEYNEEEIDL